MLGSRTLSKATLENHSFSVLIQILTAPVAGRFSFQNLYLLSLLVSDILAKGRKPLFVWGEMRRG